jgi:hypothetical protein
MMSQVDRVTDTLTAYITSHAITPDLGHDLAELLDHAGLLRPVTVRCTARGSFHDQQCVLDEHDRRTPHTSPKGSWIDGRAALESHYGHR